MTKRFCPDCECLLIQHEKPLCGVFYICPYCGETFHFIERKNRAEEIRENTISIVRAELAGSRYMARLSANCKCSLIELAEAGPIDFADWTSADIEHAMKWANEQTSEDDVPEKIAAYYENLSAGKTPKE